MNLKTTLTRTLLAAVSLLIGAQAFAERTTTYYHTDGLGSVVAATNEAGAVLWRKDYAPYGAQIDTTPETERTAYTGKQHDEVTGLTYFGARYFDPEIGRFMSVDPVRFMESNPLTFNRYAYANNNPYKFVDPDGRVAILIPIVFGITALIGADAANAPGPGDTPEPQGAAAKSAAMSLAPLPGSGLMRQTVSSGASRGTQLGYHATRAENVESILATGLRPSTGGRAGSGVYVSSSAEGAMAEFAAHNPGLAPTLLQVAYTPGTNYFLQGLTRRFVQGPIPLAADTISFGSVRLQGTVNTVIRNESATVLGVVTK
jgi:RHS repeat-associated protein